MKVLKKNKGLVIFYLTITVFALFWVYRVDTTNDKIMYEKNSYILKDNI